MAEDLMPEGEDFLAKVGSDLVKESYSDIVKPVAKDIGEAISGILKVITYYPRFWARASDISLEEKLERFKKKFTADVEEIPVEFRVLPSPSILGPSLQALEYAVVEDDLSDMFSNLIVSSMNSSKSGIAHPSFAEIIKQITSDEAKILKFLSQESPQPVVDVMSITLDGLTIHYLHREESFIPEDAGCEHIKLGPQYLGNLQRLGLIDLPENVPLADLSYYDRLNKWFEEGTKDKEEYEKLHGVRLQLRNRRVRMSELGKMFLYACIPDKEPHHE
jgi:Abortive infection alpha